MFFNILLFLCGFGALLGPLLSERIANRLVEFIFVMGFCAATFGRVWSEAVVIEALLRPIQVCMAVLFGAFIFSFTHDSFRKCIRKILKRAGPRVAVGGAVIFVGLLAALLTSAVAVLVLCELLIAMRLQRDCEVHVAVLGCFAIGLGGGLCLIGGPVATIAIAKLSSPPYYADNWFLFHLLGGWIFPAVLTLGVLSGVLFAKLNPDRELPQVEDPYSLWKILLLAGRMYVFIAGLVLLGSGIVPLIDRTILDAPPGLLYWVNSLSAFVDGATLASVEITPRMSANQLRYILMGILIAGGALVPGNAPNLVAAHKLNISYKQWSAVGVPAAFLLMYFYFLSLDFWAG